MRIITGTALAYLIVGGAAMAADMAVSPSFVVPAMSAPWTGFYLGVNAGGGSGDARNDFGFATVDLATHGAFGGGQIGYNWQTGPFVYGAEADIQASSLKGSIATPCAAGGCLLPLSASFSQSMPWFGTVRGRVGYAQAGWLLYATGGYAYGDVDTTATAAAGPVAAQLATNQFADGWTAGGGAELAILPRWSVKLEYLHIDIARSTGFAFVGVPTIGDQLHVRSDVARAGVNYRF